MPDAANGASIRGVGQRISLAGTVIVAAIFLLAASTYARGSSVLLGCSPRLSAYPASGVAAAFAAFSCAVSLVGLDAISVFSAPLLGALYPPAIVLVVMGPRTGAATSRRACTAPCWRRRRSAAVQPARRVRAGRVVAPR